MKNPYVENLNNIVSNCKSLESKTRRELTELDRSHDRFNNFYNEYQKYIDFKKETGWYEEDSTRKEILDSPKFKLPVITIDSIQ